MFGKVKICLDRFDYDWIGLERFKRFWLGLNISLYVWDMLGKVWIGLDRFG